MLLELSVSNYPHWERKIANVPPPAGGHVMRLCHKCKTHQPIKGGTVRYVGSSGSVFICAKCRPKAP